MLVAYAQEPLILALQGRGSAIGVKTEDVAIIIPHVTLALIVLAAGLVLLTPAAPVRTQLIADYVYRHVNNV
jgi:hypothetical protein